MGDSAPLHDFNLSATLQKCANLFIDLPAQARPGGDGNNRMLSGLL
jgi:hypothetical protein